MGISVPQDPLLLSESCTTSSLTQVSYSQQTFPFCAQHSTACSSQAGCTSSHQPHTHCLQLCQCFSMLPAHPGLLLQQHLQHILAQSLWLFLLIQAQFAQFPHASPFEDLRLSYLHFTGYLKGRRGLQLEKPPKAGKGGRKSHWSGVAREDEWAHRTSLTEILSKHYHWGGLRYRGAWEGVGKNTCKERGRKVQWGKKQGKHTTVGLGPAQETQAEKRYKAKTKRLSLRWCCYFICRISKSLLRVILRIQSYLFFIHPQLSSARSRLNTFIAAENNHLLPCCDVQTHSCEKGTVSHLQETKLLQENECPFQGRVFSSDVPDTALTTQLCLWIV